MASLPGMSRIKWRRCRGRCYKHSEATIKEMEIPHEDQSSHYNHEKDKFAYLSMRDRIELGKRKVQQSQWGSKYALNEDMSMKAKLAFMARRIEEFELRNVHTEAQPQAMPTSFEYINHPNLTTQPQTQPSMSTSSLEQAILKISKVIEDFVGEQQKINSHLNEKIDNMESSINVIMEGVYNDLSLSIEKVQDSIEKLTNLDIARGKRKLPPQPHHNLQGTNEKRSRKVLKIDTLVGDCYDNSMDQLSIENHKVQDDKGLPEPFKASTSLGKRRETNSLGPNGKDANFVWDPGGIQHEVGVWFNLLNSKSTSHEVPLPSSLFSIQTLRTMFISVGGRVEETLDLIGHDSSVSLSAYTALVRLNTSLSSLNWFMGLGNLLEVVVHHLLIGGMIGLGYHDGIPMGASIPMGPNGPRSELIYLISIDYDGQIGSRFTFVHKGILVIT
uniref:Uncharacterized protein n=1 Tax=Vitis vinifera TaxID=29760 RepID=A5BPU9_VITVI|nr:hypothetical protein VITISV_041186 [Vitis vinifera]